MSAEDDQPQGIPHGPWIINSQREVYRDPWVRVRRDEVLRPDGQPGSYCVVTLKPGVCVLALDDRGDVHLTEEFHYGVGRVTVEGVSGGIEEDETALQSARRELLEELGILADNWEELGTVDPFTANVVSPTKLFLATGLSFGEAQNEAGEVIRRVAMSLNDAVNAVLEGKITHAPSCLVILRTMLLRGAASGLRPNVPL